MNGGLARVLVLGQCLPGGQRDDGLAEYVLVTTVTVRAARPLDEALAAASSSRASASREDFCTALT